MNNDRKNLIVTLADANFINQAKQLFSSVYFNAGWAGDYMLLTNGLAKQDKDWFESRGIIVYDPPLFSDKLIGTKGYPPILLSKFYFFREYFKKWQKIIFLDADIIVKTSLDRLLELNGFNAPMATYFHLRNEFTDEIVKSRAFKNEYNLKRLAFNSGIFVLDTEIINKDTYDDLVSCFEKYKDIAAFGEESIFNLFFYNKWRLLPMIYNSTPDYMNEVLNIKKEKLIAVIIHFVCMKIKPWNPKSPYYKEWLGNFERADAINLGTRPGAAKEYSKREISRYERYLKRRQIIYYFRLGFYFVDRQIGRLGLFIKKQNPKLYKLISLKK